VTWGKRIQATWEFFDKYVDEAYAIIDSQNSWQDPENDPIDIPKLEQYLAEITHSSPEPIPETSGCMLCSRFLSWIKHWRK
jgi:hypothetical protein